MEGGICHDCQKKIPAKVLNHEHSRTWAMEADGSSSHRDFEIPAAQGEQDLLGKSLGHFEIVAPLGSGGMGQVFRALDKSLQRYVAVKVLTRGSHQAGGVEVDRLLQEAIAQARVNHPNIVSIYYVGKQSGDPFLAMELVPGQTVSDRMASGKLTFYEIVSIARQINEALRASYELDILHGDIKPSNILLQENGIAKLSDFGMARSASSSAQHALGGTPNYLAPELLEGQRASVQSDIYALGVTLYEMSFGRRPVTLSGNSVSEWAKSHQDSELTFPQPWPEGIPESWKNVLQKMLARDPSKRYSSYEELSAALLKVAPTQDLPARRLPRFIATGIDYTTVFATMMVVQLSTWFATIWLSSSLSLNGVDWLSFWDSNIPWYFEVLWILVKLGFAAIGFLPLVVYTLALGYWRQSLGRALMHIRVVNQYGLRPTRRTLIGRSFLRMAPLWVLATTLNLPLEQFSTSLPNALWISAVIFSIIEVGYMVMKGNGTSLHDRWFKTRVVLDVDQQ